MAPSKSIQLDEFDLAILEELQVNNRTSLQEIGKSVNLSAAAVQRRVRRMEDARVIQSNVAIVDPASVGRPITIVVEVQIDSEQADLMDSARREFAAAPEVQQCFTFRFSRNRRRLSCSYSSMVDTVRTRMKSAAPVT